MTKVVTAIVAKTALKDRIVADMQAAMRSKDSARLGAIRLLLAAIKQKEVDERIALDDVAVLAVIDKLLKQRRDSISQYEAAKREDLASAERFELEILQAYQPPQLSPSEIAAVVDEACVAWLQAGHKLTMSEMGKIMAEIKPQFMGRADMAIVSKLIKAKLLA